MNNAHYKNNQENKGRKEDRMKEATKKKILQKWIFEFE